MSDGRKDLIVLVADKSMEEAVEGVLSRPPSLGIQSIRWDTFRHSEKDAGCRTHGVAFLEPHVRSYRYALLMFDREGCGDETTPVEHLEESLRRDLQCLWADRADVVVIEPELDIWVWSDSPRVDEIIGWPAGSPSLRSWLASKEFLVSGQRKPSRPKEALETVLRHLGKPRSSSLYGDLARRVSLRRCEDRAFQNFKRIMQRWFGGE